MVLGTHAHKEFPTRFQYLHTHMHPLEVDSSISLSSDFFLCTAYTHMQRARVGGCCCVVVEKRARGVARRDSSSISTSSSNALLTLPHLKGLLVCYLS